MDRPWRVLGVRRATPARAVEEGLRLLGELAAEPAPTAVWWDVDEPALMLSRGSRVRPDVAACDRAGVTAVRRGSGGGPVLWDDRLLSLDVLVPRDHRRWSADVVASYRWLGETLAAVLRDLGVPGARAVAPDTARSLNDPRLAALSCYGGVSPWEVMVDDRKLVGLSQVRRAPGLLLQAGIPIRPHDDLALLLDVEDRGALRGAIADSMTSLSEHGVDPRDVIPAATEAIVADGTA